MQPDGQRQVTRRDLSEKTLVQIAAIAAAAGVLICGIVGYVLAHVF